MMRSPSPLIPILALLALGACEAPEVDEGQPAAETAPATEMAPAGNAEAEVASVRDAWVAASDAGDAATVAGLYAENATMVGPDGAVSEGRDAIRESLAAAFQNVSDLEVTSTDLLVGTDVISDMGTFRQTVRTPDGQEQTMSGRYVVALQRQADGSWRIVHHIATPEQRETTEM